MTKKKMTGLITASMVGVMALGSFMPANAHYAKTTAQVEQSQSQSKSERGENIFKTKRGLINKPVLKSVLNLNDEELKAKLAEHENNVYKLLESCGKVEEYKAVYLKTVKEKIAKAVADGKITQEKADVVYSKAEEAMRDFNADTGSLGRIILTPENQEKASFNFNSDELQEDIGKAKEVFGNLQNVENFNFGLDIATLAEIFGMSVDELNTALLENNGNLFGLLEEMGRLEKYKEVALELTKDALETAVSHGRITQETADMIYDRAKEVIGNLTGSEIPPLLVPGDDFVEYTFIKFDNTMNNFWV